VFFPIENCFCLFTGIDYGNYHQSIGQHLATQLAASAQHGEGGAPGVYPEGGNPTSTVEDFSRWWMRSYQQQQQQQHFDSVHVTYACILFSLYFYFRFSFAFVLFFSLFYYCFGCISIVILLHSFI
jgi:hypothetical protein